MNICGQTDHLIKWTKGQLQVLIPNSKDHAYNSSKRWACFVCYRHTRCLTQARPREGKVLLPKVRGGVERGPSFSGEGLIQRKDTFHESSSTPLVWCSWHSKPVLTPHFPGASLLESELACLLVGKDEASLHLIHWWNCSRIVHPWEKTSPWRAAKDKVRSPYRCGMGMFQSQWDADFKAR